MQPPLENDDAVGRCGVPVSEMPVVPSLYDPAARISRGGRARSPCLSQGSGRPRKVLGLIPATCSLREETNDPIPLLFCSPRCFRCRPDPHRPADPREQSFQFYVDGVADGRSRSATRSTSTTSPVSRTDSRRLDTAYSPDQRRFVITVTQKGLNRLQDWLNSATRDRQLRRRRTLSLVVRTVGRDDPRALGADGRDARRPCHSAGAGTLTEVDATIEFQFDTLTLSQAKAD